MATLFPAVVWQPCFRRLCGLGASGLRRGRQPCFPRLCGFVRCAPSLGPRVRAHRHLPTPQGAFPGSPVFAESVGWARSGRRRRRGLPGRRRSDDAPASRRSHAAPPTPPRPVCSPRPWRETSPTRACAPSRARVSDTGECCEHRRAFPPDFSRRAAPDSHDQRFPKPISQLNVRIRARVAARETLGEVALRERG